MKKWHGETKWPTGAQVLCSPQRHGVRRLAIGDGQQPLRLLGARTRQDLRCQL